MLLMTTTSGFAEVAATFNSTGQKTTTINVSAGQSVQAGDDLWLLIGCQATTALVMRAQSIADDLQSGAQASAVVPSSVARPTSPSRGRPFSPLG